MNNKTITTFLLSATMIMGFSIIPGALAHDYTASYWFSSSSQNICYNESSLNSIKYEGSTGQGTTVAGQIQYGEDEMDDNTDLNISHDTSCGTYESEVSSWYDSDTGKLAKTDLPVNSHTSYEWKDMEYNNNSGINWQQNGDNSCGSTPEMSRVANHEFGHFAGMEHHGPIFSSHTMMKSSCSIYWNSIGSGDETQVNGEY